MTTAIEVPMTAKAVLFGSSGAAETLEESLGADRLIGTIGGGAARLAGDTRRAVCREISAATSDLLSFDLIGMLFAAWRKHAALAAAARRTAAAPGASEVVELATHTVNVTQRPYIDVFLDDARIGRIHLELGLAMTVAAMVAVVRGGNLVAIQSGHCTVAAALRVEDMRAVSGRAHLDLPLAVSLGPGIALLPGPPRTPTDGGGPAA